MFRKSLFLVILLAKINFLLGDVIVQLPNGLINGREGTTLENKHYYAFEGIPYAAPPIGERRFKAPQPAENWDDIRDATSFGFYCYQISSNSESETEDCLYLSVFTPDIPNEDNNVSLPVILYIHGGGFGNGDGINIGADLFLNNDVILVSFNYRLGIFGFISTQDSVIPGNNGLKDQQFAIKWVHNNIALFGGDPDRITIMGHSAGSASSAYQLINQDNNGLFQAAILESGSSISPCAYQRRSREIAFTTASFLDSTFANSTDSQALLEFLLTVDAGDLDRAATQYRDMESGPEDIEVIQGLYWAPVIEEKNPDAFITKNMYGLVQAGNVLRVPILQGITSEETIAFYPDSNDLQSIMTAFDENLDWLVPNDMQISDQNSRVEMGRLIRELYTDGEPLAEHLGDGVRFISDTSFTRSIIKHAELFSEVTGIYFYIFSYDGLMGGGDVHYDGADSVGHGEELNYLLCTGDACDDSGFPEADRVTRQRLIKIWTDFVKYHNPTPEPSEVLQNLTWPLLSTDNGDFYYVDINENLEIRNHPKEETYGRWNELYASLSFDDFDTY